MRCSRCQQDTPTIVRGARAYCTVCGAERPLLSDMPINVAGRPARFGGLLSRGFGWFLLLGGLLTASLLGLLVQGLFHFAIGTAILTIPIVFFALLLGLPMIIGGKKLQQSGEQRSRDAHEEAIFALAASRQGSLTVPDVARALAISQAEADAMLTALAKRPDGRMSLDVDDDGTLRYIAVEFAPRGRFGERIAAEAPKVRVAGSPERGQAADEALREAEAEADAAARERRTSR